MESTVGLNASSKAESSESEEEMPLGGWGEDRKGRRRQNVLNASADVNLQAYADCSVAHSGVRLKKSVVGAAISEAIPKAGNTQGAQKRLEKEEEELGWFDKDLDDFDVDVDDTPAREEEEDLAEETPKPEPTKRGKGKGKFAALQIQEKAGIMWPIDLWDVLSDYISPEDIGRFARLCHGSLYVVRLSAFWRKLYWRYYWSKPETESKKLPVHLKPASMEKMHGLRARVIRSLYHLYQPLADKVKTRGPMEDEPHDLVGHRCLLVWHQPTAKGWQFCFKLQKPSFHSSSSILAKQQDVYNGYNDVLYNPEEGCCLLKVTCCHFAHVPAVMGLLLNQVYVTLSAGLRHHRLRMHFDSRVVSGSSQASDAIVVLDDVVSIKVMRWWHPAYPYDTFVS